MPVRRITSAAEEAKTNAAIHRDIDCAPHVKLIARLLQYVQTGPL
jgi:hypothetical protein